MHYIYDVMLGGGLYVSGRMAPYRFGGSQYQPRRGTADDGDLVVLGVHTL